MECIVWEDKDIFGLIIRPYDIEIQIVLILIVELKGKNLLEDKC